MYVGEKAMFNEKAMPRLLVVSTNCLSLGVLTIANMMTVMPRDGTSKTALMEQFTDLLRKK
jgi:hypothetical protein